MIAKNEASTLARGLQSLAALVTEIIVVDTGSTDETKVVAARYGARVFDFTWVDSFAAARNESLRHAAGDWIFWLDGDEYLDDENRAKFQAVLGRLEENAAYVMRQRSAPEGGAGAPTLVDQCRLFRNRPDIRWSYRVHEQILPAVNRLRHEVVFTDICIDHSGYVEPALRAQKTQRNLRLLLLEEAEQPNDPFTLFNLGWTYQDLGQPARAIPYLKRSLERCGPGDSIVRKLFALLAHAHQATGQLREALSWCRAGRVRCPDDAELLFQEGVLLRALHDPSGAEAAWQTLLDVRPGQHFASVDAGLRGYKTRFHLGLLLREQGRADEAQEHWRRAVAERPDFLAAWGELAELCLAESRWDSFHEAISHLPAEGPGLATTLVLRGRAHLARREFGPARQVLEEGVARFPQEFPPRLFLSRVLLEEGADPAAAEAALRDLVGRAPKLAEGWRNLLVLLRQEGRRDEAVAVGRAGLSHCPSDPMLLYYVGTLLSEVGDMAGAEAALLRYLQTQPAGGGTPNNARHILALVYQRMKRPREAEAQWRALLANKPDFPGAWAGLAEVCLEGHRWDDLDEIIGQVAELPKGQTEAAVLRARKHLAQREFAPALALLDKAIAAEPEAVYPRLIRSRVLLDENRDAAAAEQALRDVLVLDSDNREAMHNLQLLLAPPNGTTPAAVNSEKTMSGGERRGTPIPRKCLRVAFASYWPHALTTDTAYERPLGGSESALCYLTEALAARGHEVFLLSMGQEPAVARGVTCLPLDLPTVNQLPALDAFVIQNLAGHGRSLRSVLGPKTRLVLWTQHATDQPAVQPLRDSAESAAYDSIVFVSDWQRQEFIGHFVLNPHRTTVLRNAIAPVFQGLFADGESILARKAKPPVLAYTSTPYRGLDLLLEAFPRIRAEVPDLILKVFSSTKLYGVPGPEDDERYGALYRRCRETEGVEYVGSVPQPRLAEELRAAAALAYPNTYAETSCIAVLEAMAAGCVVVTSERGALPETTAGFGRLVPIDGDRNAYLDRFVKETADVIRGLVKWEPRLQQQIQKVHEAAIWSVRAREWNDWLTGLVSM